MLLSLHSFYFQGLGFPLLPVLGMLFSLCFVFFAAFFFRYKLVGALGLSFFSFLFIGILLFLSCLSIFFLGVDPLWARFFALPLFVGLVIHFCYLKLYHSSRLEASLKWCLITHLSFFWLQIISHYSGLGFLDYLEPITGESQRVFGGSYNVPIIERQLIRGAGLYSEPGTFATFIFLFYLLYKAIYCFNRDVRGVVFGWFDFVVVLSIVFSFSIFGFIFVSLYLFFSLFFAWKRVVLLSPLLVCFAYFAFETYVYPRFFGGVSTETGLGFRSEGVLIYLDKVFDEPYLFFFGSGFFNDYSIFSSSIVWNDLGLLFSFFMIVGVVGFFLVFLLFALAAGGMRFYDFLLLTVLCLSKVSLSMALFWLLISAVLGKQSSFNKIQ